MWREIGVAAGAKPLVAAMGDVAASGGYYMAMAAPTVVAHPLTITGSIGVVTGKFNLAELYEKARCRCVLAASMSVVGVRMRRLRVGLQWFCIASFTLIS